MVQNGTEIQTSRQRWVHLLCKGCEQLLSKHGERWVLTNTKRGLNSFPLMDTLLEQEPTVVFPPNTAFFSGQLIPGVNVAALMHFGAGVFWRASVWPWGPAERRIVHLGPFEESFRRFLIGEAEFPEHAYLCVVVRVPSDMDSVTHEPSGGRSENMHLYTFPMPGLLFYLGVGRNVEEFFRKACIVHGVGNPISISTLGEAGIKKGVLEAMRRADEESLRRTSGK